MKDQPISMELLAAKQYTDWMVKTGGYAKDMTLRDHFAGLALPLMLQANVGRWAGNHSLYAEQAYEFADAMLKERAK